MSTLAGLAPAVLHCKTFRNELMRDGHILACVCFEALFDKIAFFVKAPPCHFGKVFYAVHIIRIVSVFFHSEARITLNIGCPCRDPDKTNDSHVQGFYHLVW